MTLDQICRTDCYIICANVEERDRIIGKLKSLGLEKAGACWSDQKIIRLTEIFSGYATVNTISTFSQDPVYQASQFLHQSEPPLTC